MKAIQARSCWGVLVCLGLLLGGSSGCSPKKKAAPAAAPEAVGEVEPEPTAPEIPSAETQSVEKATSVVAPPTEPETPPPPVPPPPPYRARRTTVF